MRLVIQLTLEDQLSNSQASEVLGRPLGTVDSYKKRGLERLRAMPEIQKYRDLLEKPGQ